MLLKLPSKGMVLTVHNALALPAWHPCKGEAPTAAPAHTHYYFLKRCE